ncbi:unnamed protein product [Bemisia tabaci]|uniref:Uncharacterized protein n=2 Tax=Bemisia tabaci TaxID=7038 RepID=A0A9P0A8R6_BEMTA|nr:unnamed protein product [Bemisia tabaci]
MFCLKFGSVVLLALIVSPFSVICFDLKACLKFHKVYPEVITTIPKQKVVIFYGEKEVNYGTPMTIKEVENAPSVAWAADPKSLYTLMVTDPDAPSETMPYIKEDCFWWVANIKGNNISTGDAFVGYKPPHPSFRPGSQAYVFVVYKQPGHVTYLTNTNIDEDQTENDKFRVAQVAKAYNLSDPIAINLFQIRHPGQGKPAGPEDCPPYVPPTPHPPEDHGI